MNREERRNLKKLGVSDKTIKDKELLEQPCSIGETIQLARAAAQDVCQYVFEAYRRDTSSLMMAMTLQIDILKAKLIAAGMFSEEEFIEEYKVAAEKFHQEQKEYLEKMKEESPDKSPDVQQLGTVMKISDINVEVTKESKV